MPQLIALALAGAGLYVGYRWLARELQRATQAAAQARAERERQAAEVTGAPKDLGALVWDEKAGVYRPSRQNSASNTGCAADNSRGAGGVGV